MLDLPSFMWLWRIAAWSMGLTVTLYGCLALLGGWIRHQRLHRSGLHRSGLHRSGLHASEILPSPSPDRPSHFLTRLHTSLGILLTLTVLELLAIGIIGTLGHYGSLGHSQHLPAGLIVVALTLLSLWSASQIHPLKPWARSLHLTTNVLLLVALVFVTWTGWVAVQKYLP